MQKVSYCRGGGQVGCGKIHIGEDKQILLGQQVCNDDPEVMYT